jgi:DNA-binding NtrC family response regulator
MSPFRSSATDLARLFNLASDPVYVLDGTARMVFLNAACRDWLGEAADELLGQQCRYHSTPNEQGRIPLSGLLCPPPEVFEGRRASADVVLPAGEGPPQARRVDFIPLARVDDETAGVVAIASSPRPFPDEMTHGEDPSPAELHARLERHRRLHHQRYQIDRLVGDVPAMKRVRAQVEVAATTAVSVLIVGPPGSGRQHVARAIHYARPLSELGPMLPLACPLLTAELLQSGLRGLVHPKSGTPAGRIATLLLNDVDAMPPEIQAELAGLLRAELPVRIISTARQPLSEIGAQGTFRPDLSCLLSTLLIELPALSERLEDLPLLAQMFLEEANARGAKQVGGFAPESLDALAAYAWPGQLDELAEMVFEAHARAEGIHIEPRDLPPRIGLSAEAGRFARRPEETIVIEQFLADIERELIERALARAKGNKSKAAELLGMTRPRLYRRLVQLGLEEEIAWESEGESPQPPAE